MEKKNTSKTNKVATKPLKKTQETSKKEDGIKIGVVGVGAIGTPFALILAQNGYDVEITKKSDNALIIDNCMNLEINGAFGDKAYLIPFVQDNKFTSKKDIIIMCTQSYSTAGALKEVKKYLKPNGIVVSIQNVLNISEVLKEIPKDRYIPLVVDWSAKRIDTNQVYVLRTGEMHIGAFNENAQSFLPIVKKLFDLIQPTVVEEEMYAFIASRFILKTAIASVIAITGHNLKKTVENKVARNLIIGTIKEMLDVFESFGLYVPPYCGVLDYYKFTSRGFKNALYRRKMFSRFITKNGDMGSSLLRALENKKKTELDNMCARIVKLAEEREVKVPFNTAIAKFLENVENGKETIFMENLSYPYFTKLKVDWR